MVHGMTLCLPVANCHVWHLWKVLHAWIPETLFCNVHLFTVLLSPVPGAVGKVQVNSSLGTRSDCTKCHLTCKLNLENRFSFLKWIKCNSYLLTLKQRYIKKYVFTASVSQSCVRFGPSCECHLFFGMLVIRQNRLSNKRFSRVYPSSIY